MSSEKYEQYKLDKSIELVRKYVPGLKVTYKSDSKLHLAIGKLLNILGSSNYMSSCWTTLHTWVARPTMVNDSPHPNEWQVILHEGQHAIDSMKLGKITFGALYLLPQLLGIVTTLLALGLVPFIIGGLSPWFLLLFLGGLFLLPLPAIFRSYFELKAYEVSLGVAFWSGTIDNEGFWIESVAEIFAGNVYYKMWPFKSWTKKRLARKLEEFKRGTPLPPYLTDCKKMAQDLREWPY